MGQYYITNSMNLVLVRIRIRIILKSYNKYVPVIGVLISIQIQQLSSFSEKYCFLIITLVLQILSRIWYS